MLDIDVFLASNSPRRHELLAQIGVCFASVSVDVDESARPGESARQLVQRLALDKACAGLKVRPVGHHEPVMGSDTLVVFEGVALGKPQNRDDAFNMWARLSGHTHEVMTAVALVSESQQETILQVSEVTFREMSTIEMVAYWDSGEPQDKAGGYGIQGIASVFIEHLVGSYSGVMGLPLYETAKLLGLFDINVLERKDET